MVLVDHPALNAGLENSARPRPGRIRETPVEAASRDRSNRSGTDAPAVGPIQSVVNGRPTAVGTVCRPTLPAW